MSKAHAQSEGTGQLLAVEPSHKPTGEPSTWVRQDRKLALAYYTMSINEMRLVWELASRTRLSDDALHEHEFTLGELRQIFGEHLSFDEAENLLMRLYRRELHIDPAASVTASLRWIISATRDKERETFLVALHPKLKSYFIGLQQWVQSEKATLFAFSSEYAARLYMWACVYRNQQVQTWEISIPDLRARLGIPADHYKRFSNLRTRVLDAPVKEINERAAPFVLSFTIRKRSYTPVAVVFSLSDWQKTTTGTGASVGKKIRKRIRKTKAEKPSAEEAAKPLLTPEEAAAAAASVKQTMAAFRKQMSGGVPTTADDQGELTLAASAAPAGSAVPAGSSEPDGDEVPF